MNNKLSKLSKILLVVAGVCLTISIFVPIWQIDLDAPQYPEGLNLKIYSYKLAGNVDIINGLNHYIGMKTLHADDFVEFTVLPYIIGFFALFSIIAGTIGGKKMLYLLLTLFVLFGIIAMVDFWRWEYDYGHNLDPHAAIIVPGMAYQPPLIGFKQLLNFGAYSIPDRGGWLFIGSGVLMLLATMKELNFLRKRKTNTASAVVVLLVSILFTACSQSGPEPINLHKDDCDNCKMTISDKRFACELVTEKGRAYKFDDISCLTAYKNENSDKMNNAKFYINDYLSPNNLVLHTTLSFVEGEEVASPMGGNIAGFTNKDSANVYLTIWGAESIAWEEIK